MSIQMRPIGKARTQAKSVPRHWSVSKVRGRLEIEPEYQEGLRDIRTGQRIIVLFHFDRSPLFNPQKHLVQKPPHKDRSMGVFSVCSPVRPNPIGLSVLKVLAVNGSSIEVEGVDMLDNTPILDIKPHIEGPGREAAKR